MVGGGGDSVVCILRPYLSRLSPRFGAMAAVFMAGVVAMVCAGALHMLYTSIGGRPLVAKSALSVSSRQRHYRDVDVTLALR